MRTRTPGGMLFARSSTAARTPRATETVSAPNCLEMRQLTISEPSPCAMPRRTAGASRTSATSPSSTGVVSRTATTVARRSPTFSARPTARTVHSIGPWATKPPGGVLVGPLDRGHHLAQGHAEGRHAVGIELHLELAQVSAEHLDGRHAGHAEEAVPHLVVREIAQLHEAGRPRLRLEDDLHHLVEPAGEAGDQRSVGPRREVPRHLVDPLGDELAREVVVGVRLELDADQRHAGLGARADAAHLGQARQRDLQRDRHAGLQLLGAHGRVLDVDAEDRRREVGEDVALQLAEPDRAGHGRGEHQEDGEGGLARRSRG